MLAALRRFRVGIAPLRTWLAPLTALSRAGLAVEKRIAGYSLFNSRRQAKVIGDLALDVHV